MNENNPPCEAGSLQTFQKISAYCGMKIQYHLHKKLPLVPNISQANSLHILALYLFAMYFNIIL
jgi:hypothetical protein